MKKSPVISDLTCIVSARSSISSTESVLGIIQGTYKKTSYRIYLKARRSHHEPSTELIVSGRSLLDLHGMSAVSENSGVSIWRPLLSHNKVRVRVRVRVSSCVAAVAQQPLHSVWCLPLIVASGRSICVCSQVRRAILQRYHASMEHKGSLPAVLTVDLLGALAQYGLLDDWSD